MKAKNAKEGLMSLVLLDWLMIAAQLPGKSLHVGVALWAMGQMHNSRAVPLSNITSLRFGLDRKHRAGPRRLRNSFSPQNQGDLDLSPHGQPSHLYMHLARASSMEAPGKILKTSFVWALASSL